MKSVIQNASRIIIKVGSSLVTNDGRGLDHAAIARWAAQISALRALGKDDPHVFAIERHLAEFD